MSFNEFLEKQEIENTLNRLFKGEIESKEESKYEVISKNEIDKKINIVEEPIETIEKIVPKVEEVDVTELFMDDYQKVNESPEIVDNLSKVVFMGGGIGRGEADLAIQNQAQDAIFTPNSITLTATTIKTALYQTDTNIRNVATSAYDLYREIEALALSAGAVTSVFGRASDVLAQSGDYNASQISYGNSNVSATIINLMNYDNALSANISANYYTKSEVNNISANLYSALSGDSDSWVSVSANYYTKTETVNGTPDFQLLEFNTTAYSAANPSHKEGTLFWDYTNHTLAMYNNNSEVTLQIGQENWIRVVNRTGAIIPNGTFVRINGAHGDLPKVAPVIASSGYGADGTIGCTTHHLGINEEGYITTEGVVNDVNTSGFVEGQPLFLSNTVSGGYQTTMPSAPNSVVFVGIVLRANQNTGKIFVTIRTSPKLVNLSDVDGITPENYSMLTYVSSGGYWDASTVQWDDLLVPATQLRLGATSKPDFDYTNVGLLFPQNDATEQAYLSVQFPHKRKNGSDVAPHIHIIQTTSALPVFVLQYRWYNNGAIVPAFTTVSATSGIFPYTSGSMMQIMPFPRVNGISISAVSSQFDGILWRNDGIVTGDVLLKQFDIHYQSDSFGGSRTEYSK